MLSQTKKIKQDELRRLMSLQKKKISESAKRIESPLARYDEDGTLNCVICQTIVRSEGVWSVHLNSKKHKDNVASKLKKKEQAVVPQPNELLKRPASPPPTLSVSPKKIKSILKNAHPPPPPPPPAPSFTNESLKKSLDKEKNTVLIAEQVDSDVSDEEDNEEPSRKDGKKDVLPEGFFDDPKLDAKVRNVEYRDPIEEEWEHFQREIREETSKAQQIIAEDQEEATTERQIDEIDEQMRNWNRVVILEKKKQEVSAASAVPSQPIKEEDLSEEENFEEFLDWRAKRSFD